MNKTTLGEVYQAHESHINFIMQFMIDFNLHGMSFMNISEIKFRKDVMKVSCN